MNSVFDLIILQNFDKLNFHFTMIPLGAVGVDSKKIWRKKEIKDLNTKLQSGSLLQCSIQQ